MRVLTSAVLPSILFHAEPLLNGHDAYRGLSLEIRSRLLTSFRVFFRHLPIRYVLLSFKLSEFNFSGKLATAMRKALIELLFDNFDFLQSYDVVKIYYDGGQVPISWAVKRAVKYALSKEAIAHRSAVAYEYSLSQVTDYVCALEAVVIRYEENGASPTDEKFFGGWGRFKKGPYKDLRKKVM